jgi:transposase
MVWGAIGWDWKSPLIFLVKEPGRKGICSTAYLNQVLKPVVFPWFDSLTTEQKKEYMFMEDGAKIHKGMAKLPRTLRGLLGFD